MVCPAMHSSSLRPMRRRAASATIVLANLLGFAGAFARTSASVYWRCMPPDSQNVSAVSGNLNGLRETGSPGFVVRDYNNGPGPDQRWWPFEDGAPVSWGNETGRVDTRWVQFAVHPGPGFAFHADSITVYLGAKGTSNMKADLLFDTDASFSDAVPMNGVPIDLVKDDDARYAFPLDADVADGETLFVRIYPWYTGSPSTSKYLYVRDCSLRGMSEAVGYPASSVWALTDPDAGGTGRTVATSGPMTAEEEMLHNTEINQYTGPDQSQRVRIAGNAWPAQQTTRMDTVFVQFAVSPGPGRKLTVTSVSLGIGAASIGTMKANIAYSADPTFTDFTIVEYTTSDPTGNDYLPLDSLTPVSALPGLVVDAGETFYLRVFPWVDGDPSVRTGKYVCLKEIVIEGEVEGTVVIDRPSVITAAVTSISTTHATGGGSIPSDGGSPVTARGICWNTAGVPTTSDSRTEDGAGSGMFESRLTGLAPGVTYHLRAYASNEAGTAYGEEKTFATRDAVVAPTVTTRDVTQVLVYTAACGGEVVDWGGEAVVARGVCWNLSGAPTLADSRTENGAGTGAFTSLLTSLTADTEYHVRAYATNSAGTGYGDEIVFSTQSPAPDIMRIVARDGSGDHATVQEAFDAIPDFYTGAYTVYVKAGIYHEKLLLDRNKTNVVLRGENPETTILTYDDYAGKAGGTSKSQSVAIDADDFTAVDITFQNTVINDGAFADQQAVALRVNGDRQSYYNCRLLGYQDTYYAWGGRGTGRVYMHGCYIEGSVDFIFGRDVVVFDSCEIHINRQSGTLTAASTEPETAFGYVFRDCRITAGSIGFDGRPITSFHLGRPWQKAPRTVFIRCSEPASLSPQGWSAWNVPPALYAEYRCTGPGSDFSNRSSISRQLTDAEAGEYTLENMFGRSTHPDFGYDWLPARPVSTAVDTHGDTGRLPGAYALYQNYPNPFNAGTTIRYDLPESGRVMITLYTILGREVRHLVEGEREAGRYAVALDAEDMASGIYCMRIRAGNFVQMKKMILMK